MTMTGQCICYFCDFKSVYIVISLIYHSKYFAKTSLHFSRQIIWFSGLLCKFLFTGRDKVTVPSHHQSPPDAETCQGNSVYHFIITALLHKSYHDASNDDSNQLLTSSLIAFQLLSLLRLLRLSRLVRYAGQWEEVIVSCQQITLTQALHFLRLLKPIRYYIFAHLSCFDLDEFSDHQ